MHTHTHFFIHQVPGVSRPSRSHPSLRSWLCDKAASRSRTCRPLSAWCGTVASGLDGLYSPETIPETAESNTHTHTLSIWRVRVCVCVLCIFVCMTSISSDTDTETLNIS